MNLRLASACCALALTALAPAAARAQPAPAAGDPKPASPPGPPAEPASGSREPGSTGARAKPAIVLPTVLEPAARRLSSATDREMVAITGGLDVLLSDTAQDLGLAVDLTRRALPRRGPLAEIELAAQARALGGYVLAPSVEITGDDLILRLVLVDGASGTLHVRVERVAREDLSVRAVIMLRDLLAEAGGRRSGASAEGAPPPLGAGGILARPARSEGRTALAVNATIFGGFVGYSILRSSGSDDPRLLYPLLAVGAGIGLGGSLIVAEEWDVGVGDAWFLASSAWWPTLAGHLIYEGRFADSGSGDERWSFGLIGGVSGLTIGTLRLVLRGASGGQATVAHSGGGLGLIFGGVTELFVRGDIYRTPFAGMGYGAGIGWLAGAAIATHLEVAPSRVLAIDLGAVLGGLGGAALASPLLFEDPTKDQQRGWLGATTGAALIGAGIAWYATADRAQVQGSLPAVGLPKIGILGESVEGARRAPIYGLGWSGALP